MPPTNKNRTPEQNTADTNNDVIYDLGGHAVVHNDKNNFDVLRYPQDLADSKQPHYVMFYISVRKSDLIDGVEQASLNGKALRIDNSQANRVTTNGSSVALTTADVVGATSAGSQIGVMGGRILQSQIISATGAVIGGVVGLSAAPTIAATAVGRAKERTQILLKTAIALYVTGAPTAEYKANWTDSDLGIAAALGGYEGSLDTDSFTSIVRGLINQGAGAAQAAILKGADALKSNIFGDIGGTAQATSAIVPNPFKSQLFKSMGFRQFGFNYVFLPRNVTEYNEVQKIIKTFKTYMHPKFGGSKFIMNYPAEFNIVYYYKDGPNDQLFRISNCALTGMKIKYGDDDFTTFRGTEGAPTQISIRLSFTELETLTQERITDYDF